MAPPFRGSPHVLRGGVYHTQAAAGGAPRPTASLFLHRLKCLPLAHPCPPAYPVELDLRGHTSAFGSVGRANSCHVANMTDRVSPRSAPGSRGMLGVRWAVSSLGPSREPTAFACVCGPSPPVTPPTALRSDHPAPYYFDDQGIECVHSECLCDLTPALTWPSKPRRQTIRTNSGRRLGRRDIRVHPLRPNRAGQQ